MAPSVQLNIPPMAVRSSDGRVKTAKATIRKPDSEAYYASLGGCIEEVRCAFGLTLEAYAYELKVNDRQLARQIKGEDRPQLEKVFAVERFRGPLVIALARLSADVDVVTEIRVRRTA
jgi:hypothetical protein